MTNILRSLSRHEAASHPNLGVQLDVFEEQRESDEAHGPGGINLNSHLDVFYAILKQVGDAFTENASTVNDKCIHELTVVKRRTSIPEGAGSNPVRANELYIHLCSWSHIYV